MEASPEYSKVDANTLIKIYKAKIEMIRDYANDLKQQESRLAIDCDLLLKEKDTMKTALQAVQNVWDTPNKRCYRHMTEKNFDFSCRDCNENMCREVKKLCGDGQRYKRYHTKLRL